MFSRIFFLDMSERAIKTIAQAALTLLTMDGVNVLTVDLKQLTAVALTAGVISILTSIASAGIRDRGTASLVVNPPTPPDDNTYFKG